jgi:hypothetical protein
MVMPTRILTALKDDTINLYENRFVRSLIINLVTFFDRRFSEFLDDVDFSSMAKLDNKTLFTVKNSQVNLDLHMMVVTDNFNKDDIMMTIIRENETSGEGQQSEQTSQDMQEVVTVIASNFAKAVKALQNYKARSFTGGHVKYVIMGEEIAENDFGAEYLGITLNKNGNDKFNGSDIVHTYEFPSQSTGRSLYIEVSGHEENETPSLALIKEKLKLKLQERAAEDSIGGDNTLTTNMTTILAEIDALTSLDGLEHEIFSREIDATYTSYAKNLKYGTGNLLYSDFGLIDWNETRTYAPDDSENIVATRVFAGGYDAMKVEPDASQNLRFE